MHPLEKFLSLTNQLKLLEDFPIPVVVVMGSFNTGKSTLINNLLNDKICPEDPLPATSSLFYIKYGEKFAARAEGNGKSLCFPNKEQFKSFIKNKAASNFEKVEITLNHPLLTKCTVVDTPGIDSSPKTSELVKKAARRADKILYLFHQRGIDESNKKFLSDLAKEKKIGHRDISFWINCNLGKSDGTSLQATEQVLKSIFGWSPEIYLFNGHNSESIEALRRFLEINLARDTVRKLNASHRQIDKKIPSRIHKSLMIQDDLLFLDTFWSIKKDAEKILMARNILNELPLAEREIKQVLTNSQSLHLLPGIMPLESGSSHDKSLDIPEIKKLMTELAGKMMHDIRIKRIIPPKIIGKWAGILKREEFKVVAVGGFSSGKSTFFNAIMGQNILPAENRPTTTCITYIRHGPKRQAAIAFKNHLNLKLCKYEDSNVEVNREELLAVEEWLEQDSGPGRIIEILMNTGQGLKKVNKEQLLKEIKRTKKLFSPGVRSGNLDKRGAGSLFRPLPAWKAKIMNPVWEVTLIFAPATPVELDMETSAGRKEYQNLTTSKEAFRIKEINITHPAEFFKLATFVDTPGLDSTNQHHSALTTDFLRHSDAYLFFLNGKHILNKNDSRSLLEMFKLRLKDYFHDTNTGEAAQELGKFFFIINFADALTKSEREKVQNFLQKNITLALREIGLSAPKLQTALISSLQALQGKENKSFNDLLGKVRLTVWNYRGRDFLKQHLNKLQSMVEAAKAGPHRETRRFQLPGKFSAESILLPGLSEIKKEIHSRFAVIHRQVSQLKNVKQFKTFIWGPAPQGQEKVVTHIKDFNYFRWANAFNRKIQQTLTGLQKEVLGAVESWLCRSKISPSPNCLPPLPPGLTASTVMEKMDEIISGSRTFYGGLKAREARQRLSLLLEEQERELMGELQQWKVAIERYVKDLITPSVMPAVKKYLESSPEPAGPGKRASREEIMRLDNYLREVKRIEQILNTPRGV